MNILLTSVGRRTYLIKYFQEALGEKGKIFASNSVLTHSLKQADGWIITPNIYSETYVDFLLEYCITNHITVIISCFDIDLPILSAARTRFQMYGISVIVSSLEVTKICNDKWKTYEMLLNLGLDTPKTYCHLSTAKRALKTHSICYPLIIKPRWGMGSIGIYQVDNDEELDILYFKLQREIFKTYLKYESKADFDDCIIIQEMIEGQEYGLDVFNDLHGNLATIIAKKKIAMRAGETDIAEIVDNTPFLLIGNTLSQGLGHIANLDVDCFVSNDNRILTLELNCRFGGQYPFSHLAGANFPKQIIRWLEGYSTDSNI